MKKWTFVGYFDDDQQVFVGYAVGKTAADAVSRLAHRLSGEANVWDARAWAKKKGLVIVGVFSGQHENMLGSEMGVYMEDLL